MIPLSARLRAAAPDAVPDADLVSRYTAARDADSAAELVRRYGGLVYGTCRRILADPHDADDAFQAVWLVFARRAAAVRPPGMVAGWLYGVAVRTATKAKTMAAKRRARSEASDPRERAGSSQPDPELIAALHAELAGLPADLRTAVLACDLAETPRKWAAAALGWPEGTLASRLRKGRERLAAGLRRRGFAPPAAVIVPVISVPPALAAAAVGVLQSADAASPAVQLLAEAVMRTTRTWWKLGIGLVLTAGLVSGGLAAWPPDDPPATRPTVAKGADDKPAAQVWKRRKEIAGSGWVSFAPDGKRLLLQGNNPLVCLDADSLQKVWSVPKPRVMPCFPVWLPDGRTVIAALSGPLSHSLLDAKAGTVKDELPSTEPERVVRFALAPDGFRLAHLNGGELTVRRLPPGTGEVSMELGKELPLVCDPLRCPGPIAWSPDGKRLAVLRYDAGRTNKWVVVVWGAGSGVPMGVLDGHTGDATSVAFAPDGRHIATAGADGRAVIWSVPEYKQVRGFRVPDAVARQIEFAPDGKSVAVNYRRTLRLVTDDPFPWSVTASEIKRWNTATGRELPPLWPDVDEVIEYFAFRPGTNAVYTTLLATNLESASLVAWELTSAN